MNVQAPVSFVLAWAQSVKYRLQANNARLPVLPTGRNFNVEYVFTGTIPVNGQSLQALINLPFGSGAIPLDGSIKQFVSMIGEYTIENTDSTNSLDIFIQAGTTPVLKITLPPGKGINETDRELNAGVVYLISHTASTTCDARINCWAYGSSE